MRRAIIVCMTRRDLARLVAGAAALFQRRPATPQLNIPGHWMDSRAKWT